MTRRITQAAGIFALAICAARGAAHADAAPQSPDAAEIPPITELMGATGLPTPTGSYLTETEAYLQASLPGTAAVPLTTPEALYPLTGNETYDQSVTQGVEILHHTLSPLLAANTPVGVVGVSQSAEIASLVMQQLAPTGQPSDLPLHFVLLGDLMNPNGGIIARFPDLVPEGTNPMFGGATPADAFPAAIYTHEYDGLADFPRYPLDLLSDLNALIGILYDHYYPAAAVDHTIELSTSGPTQTAFYMIPTAELPLVEPLRSDGPLGNALADLLQPDLTYLVNLGYGDPLYGWSTAPANIATPAGLLPDASAFEELPGLLIKGTERGITDFVNDIANIFTSAAG